MCIRSVNLAKWNHVSAVLGAAVWMLVALGRLPGWVTLSDLKLLLLLALCVITPLAVPLVPFLDTHRPLWAVSRLVILLQPFAALITGLSLLLDTGPLAAALACVWLAFTALVALLGITLFMQKGSMPLAGVCLAVAVIYLPIGGTWLVLASLGTRPLGFSPPIVLLTAVHFHFITLAALIVTGLTGYAITGSQSRGGWRIWRVAAVSMLANPLLVAAGITLTQVTGLHWLESAAAVLLAASLMVIALLGLRFVVPATPRPLARGLLAVSSAAVLITMLFAIGYALGTATGAWAITISQMIAVHGWLNAVGFGFCGLLGWRLRIGRWPMDDERSAVCARSLRAEQG